MLQRMVDRICVAGLVLSLFGSAFAADYKPFHFSGVADDSASQQAEFDYMLQYKLFGRDYLTIGNDVVIQDKSGWNGTAGYMTANARLSLGGPVLVADYIQFGDQPTLTTGPVRANTFSIGNVNGACVSGTICLNNTNTNAATCRNVDDRPDGYVYNSSA